MNTESLKLAAVKTANWSLQATKTFFRWNWVIIKWVAVQSWAVTKWVGRIVLWVGFLPLGIFRSWRHHKKKDQAALIEALTKAQR